jgi:hypothetical protein
MSSSHRSTVETSVVCENVDHPEQGGGDESGVAGYNSSGGRHMFPCAASHRTQSRVNLAGRLADQIYW